MSWCQSRRFISKDNGVGATTENKANLPQARNSCSQVLNKMIDFVFLDAGGIILNEEKYEIATAESIVSAIRKNGIDYWENDYWKDYTEGIERFCPKSRQYVVWKVAKNNNALFAKIWEDFQKCWKRPALELMAGIERAIPKIAERHKVLMAGQYGKEVFELLSRNGLDKYFHNFFSQDDFGITKLDPRYLEQIARRSNLNPQKGVMVGDRIDKDVIPAKYLGMKTVFVKSSIYKIQKPRIPFEVPTKTLESIDEIYQAIQEITET